MASGFKNYQLAVYTELTSASKLFACRTMRWIQQVETFTLEQLQRPKSRWDDLEAVLAQAVMQVAFGQSKKNMQTYQLERARRRKPLYGRAAL